MTQVLMPENIIAVTPPPTPAACPWRRRVRVRHSFRCAAVVSSPGSSESCHEGELQDISIEGIAFVLNVPFPRGTILTVEVMSPTSPHKLTARVAHATSRNDEWLLGCELVRPLSVADLYDLIG